MANMYQENKKIFFSLQERNMNIDLTKLVTNMEEEIIINDSFELDKELFSKTSIRDLKDVKFEGTITKLCDGNY